MSIDLYWDDDNQSVILCEFNGKWSWDELHAALATIKHLSDSRERVFGAMVDIRQGLTLPNGSIFNRESLTQFQKLTSLGNNGKGPVVIVGMAGMVKTIFDTAAKLDRKTVQDVYFAETIDEARRVIYPLVAKINRASA